MCGLAGYSGIKSAAKRLLLVHALGIGIDARGGHAAGYVSLTGPSSGKAIRLAKRIGKFGDASARFAYGASIGRVCMMHARYATCGERNNVNHAHPFVIRREGKSVLYGAHNGVLSGTYKTAKERSREHTVDSRELLELLADGEYEAISRLDGYGVVTWVRPDSGTVNVVRLSSQSEFHAAHLVGGGIAWASTWSILSTALKVAGLEADETIPTNTVGLVYGLTPKGAIPNETHPEVKVAPSWRPSYGMGVYTGRASFYGANQGWHNPYDYGDEDTWFDAEVRALEQSDANEEEARKKAETEARAKRIADWRARQTEREELATKQAKEAIASWNEGNEKARLEANSFPQYPLPALSNTNEPDGYVFRNSKGEAWQKKAIGVNYHRWDRVPSLDITEREAMPDTEPLPGATRVRVSATVPTIVPPPRPSWERDMLKAREERRKALTGPAKASNAAILAGDHAMLDREADRIEAMWEKLLSEHERTGE